MAIDREGRRDIPEWWNWQLQENYTVFNIFGWLLVAFHLLESV